MAATQSEAARRKNVLDAIERVLFKARAPARSASLSSAMAPPLLTPLAAPLPKACAQVNELEAILAEFSGQNELLHTKL